jgi:hypothetical protein
MAKKITLEVLAAMMKEGFDEIHEKFVTKDEAKSFFTKDDAKNFLTKDDAKNFLTKDDAKNFLTKDDAKIFATKEELNAKFDDVLTKEDQVISMLKKIDEELAASNGARLRHQDKIDNHEIRIKKLEKLKA